MDTKSKIGGAVLVVVMALGGYWYFSPYVAMKSMQAAAQSKDADAFNDYVDYPKVRESLKGQMAALMADKLGSADQGGVQSFGAALGMAMVGPMVDAFIRPETVMKAMRDGEFQPKLGGLKTDDGAKQPEAVKWDIQRKGVNKVIAFGHESEPAKSRPSFVFQREGFFGWKLTEVRLPESH